MNEFPEYSDLSLVVCPLSVAAALSVTAAGTVEHSPTGRAFDDVLGCGVQAIDAAEWLTAYTKAAKGVEGVTFIMTSSVWTTRVVERDYIDAVKRMFGAECRPLEGVDRINAWVADATLGEIPKVLGSLPSTAALVIVNAVFFKGAWTVPFDTSQTRLAHFTRFGSIQTQCMMMSRNGDFVVATTHTSTYVVMPHGPAKRFATVCILPRTCGLDALNAAIDAWLESPGNEVSRQITVHLPRFRVEWGPYDLREPLRRMGLGAMFDPVIGPRDFAPMGPNMTVSHVVHKVVLDVDEAGSTASAATAVIPTFSLSEHLVFDRPFGVAIYDTEMKTTLFVGRVLEPKAV